MTFISAWSAILRRKKGNYVAGEKKLQAGESAEGSGRKYGIKREKVWNEAGETLQSC
jgi:hypothetical protein